MSDTLLSALHVLYHSFLPTYEAGTIILILQMTKLRHKGTKELVLGKNNE